MDTMRYFTLALVFVSLSCSNNMEKAMNSNQKANYFFEEMISDSGTPGLQYIILNADSTIFEFNGGLSDLEKKSKSICFNNI